jgi:hypothetical protein
MEKITDRMLLNMEKILEAKNIFELFEQKGTKPCINTVSMLLVLRIGY